MYEIEKKMLSIPFIKQNGLTYYFGILKANVQLGKNGNTVLTFALTMTVSKKA